MNILISSVVESNTIKLIPQVILSNQIYILYMSYCKKKHYCLGVCDQRASALAAARQQADSDVWAETW